MVPLHKWSHPHNGHGHWLNESSSGCQPGNKEIFVYDSMHPSLGLYTKKQIAATGIAYSEDNTITLKMIIVQLQDGGADCGLFAIVFATALANSINPCECYF